MLLADILRHEFVAEYLHSSRQQQRFPVGRVAREPGEAHRFGAQGRDVDLADLVGIDDLAGHRVAMNDPEIDRELSGPVRGLPHLVFRIQQRGLRPRPDQREDRPHTARAEPPPRDGRRALCGHQEHATPRQLWG